MHTTVPNLPGSLEFMVTHAANAPMTPDLRTWREPCRLDSAHSWMLNFTSLIYYCCCLLFALQCPDNSSCVICAQCWKTLWLSLAFYWLYSLPLSGACPNIQLLAVENIIQHAGCLCYNFVVSFRNLLQLNSYNHVTNVLF